VVLSFQSVDKTLKCNDSNETFSGVLSNDTVYCAALILKATKPEHYSGTLYCSVLKVVLPFQYVDKYLKCNDSYESY